MNSTKTIWNQSQANLSSHFSMLNYSPSSLFDDIQLHSDLDRIAVVLMNSVIIKQVEKSTVECIVNDGNRCCFLIDKAYRIYIFYSLNNVKCRTFRDLRAPSR